MAKRIIPIIVALTVVGYFGYQALEKRREAKLDKSFYGTVEAVETMVGTQLAGRIMELNVSEGQAVKEGDLIARVDDTLYSAQLDQARAARKAAASQQAVLDANLALLDQNLGRARRLYNADAAPRSARDDLRLRRKTVLAQKDALDARIGQADAAVALAEKQLGYVEVTAPVSGVAVKVHAERGELAFPGSALVTIADLSRMEVRIYVPEPMLGKINLGDAVEIRTDSFPDRRIPAKVSYIAEEAEFTPKNVQTKEERVRLVYAVKVVAQNPDGVLKIGMPVDAEFVGK